MTTVAQLIAHLQTLPQEATVQCLSERFSGYSAWSDWTDLDIKLHVSVTDFRNNQFVKPESSLFNKVFVEIGDK